ncbi:hypothetical protein HA402_001633 [Bradysia odoriphaga]|nr:hypothetical protein HA402_001633 [Bradysia odoriphaga]
MSVTHKILSISSLLNVLKTNISLRTITSSSVLEGKKNDMKRLVSQLPKRDEGTAGEKSTLVDSLFEQKVNVFPDANTNTAIFHGQMFNDIPIIHVRVSKNNTIMTFSDAKGITQLSRSCGIDGFKNCRKGTNIAAQTTASIISQKVVERGIKTIRVTVRGLGAGRLSALKGIQLSGLNVVSVTDTTPVSWHPPRPRKARRL